MATASASDVRRLRKRLLVAVALGATGSLVACSFFADYGALTAGNGTDASGDDANAGDAPEPCAPLYVPTPGIYLYDSLDGGDLLLINGSPVGQIPFDDPISASVTLDTDPGCWTIDMLLSKNVSTGAPKHEHVYKFCNDGGLVGVGEVDNFYPFSGSSTTSTYYCSSEPYITPCVEAGTTVSQGQCSGVVAISLPSIICNGPTFNLRIYLSDSAYTFHGIETLTVGNADVPVLHYTQVRATTLETQAGSAQAADWWFLLEGGLPVRHEGHTVVSQNIVAGDAAGCVLEAGYSSTLSWSLRSLSPFPLLPDQ